MNAPSQYLVRCLDPVHIGSGGYRLGRVDMSIVREPATGIPKIPGTSLAGAIRAYAEMAKAEDASLPDVNVVFGNSEGQNARQGMLRFYDADIVLFPVLSDQGTVWVSTAERLRLCGFGHIPDSNNENAATPLKGLPAIKPINLGWLLLPTNPSPDSAALIIPEALSFVNRLVAVSDKLFHHLVNDHLEVRTSVKIDDATGAAEAGALFTYEAIPRGTILRLEIYIDRRRGIDCEPNKIDRMLTHCFTGLKLLGVGGMGTRGFGRLEVLNGVIR
jgi:CRISPR-associated protein Cmr4